jgi:condensin complex subunit 1
LIISGDILQEIRENQILYDSILATILPIVKSIVEKISKAKNNLSSSNLNTTLAHTCIITMFKFATVSYKFCNDNIPMLIELISKDMDPALVIKSLMGLSDLIKRFPQVVEPFSQRLFETLESKHRNVKKVSMIIITHLILNDMLKIKGEIVDIIMKLADEDIEIRKFTELFMMQLHKKDAMVRPSNTDHQQLAP